MYKIIDKSTWNRKKQFEWFQTFSNPCYGIDIEVDVTEVVKFSKESKTSFFINFLYIVMKSLNSIEELRLRIVGKEIRLYDVIHPTYTVMTKGNVFENCANTMHNEYTLFYEECHKVIEATKCKDKVDDMYNDDSRYDVYYITCLPWLEYVGMTHPLPDHNEESSSVPRVCWGKYTEKNQRLILPFNLIVSHSLVDGYPCSKALNLLKQNCLDSYNLLSKK